MSYEQMKQQKSHDLFIRKFPYKHPYKDNASMQSLAIGPAGIKYSYSSFNARYTILYGSSIDHAPNIQFLCCVNMIPMLMYTITLSLSFLDIILKIVVLYCLDLIPENHHDNSIFSMHIEFSSRQFQQKI